MKKSNLFIIIALFLLFVPSVSSEILVQTLGQDNVQGEDAQIQDITDSEHEFYINKYFTTYAEQEELPRITVIPGSLEDSIVPCTEANFTFQIINQNLKEDIYSLSMDGFEGMAYYPPNIALPQKSGAQVTITLIPSCDITGVITPTLIISTQDKEEAAEIPLFLNISDKYLSDIYFEESVDVCNHIEYRIPVKVVNGMHFDNNYTLSTDKAWAKFTQEEVMVEASGTKTIDLIVTPEFQTDSETSIIFTIDPLYGDKYQKYMEIYSSNCYGQMSWLSSSEKICQGDSSVEFTIKNTGTKAQEMKVSRGDTVFYIEENEFLLPPGMEKRIEALVPEDISPGRYLLAIHSTIEGAPYFYEEFTQEIEVISGYDCFKPELLTGRMTVPGTEERRAVELISRGLSVEEYSITAYPEWISIKDDDIVLFPEKSESIEVVFKTDEVKQGTYDGEIVLISDEEGYEYRLPFEVKVSRYTFFDYVLMNKCMILLVVAAFGILLFFIKLLLDLSSGSRKAAYIDLLAILFFLLIAVFVSIFCFDSIKDRAGLEYMNNVSQSDNLCTTHLDEEICGSDYYISFDEDTAYPFDLSTMFYDPDGDPLTFSASGQQNIDVTISGEVATLIPSKNWYGVEEIMFTAKDDEGGLAESRKFYIHVLDKEEFYFQDFILDNHLTLSVIAFMVIVLLIGFLVFKLASMQEEKNQEGHEEHEEENNSDKDHTEN